jgi:hypothetical protein
VELGRLKVADHREPVGGVAGRVPPSIDAAVVALDQVARGIDRQAAGIGVGRRAGCGVRVRDVRGLAPGRSPRVDSEEPAGVVPRAYGIGPARRRGKGFPDIRLPVAPDVDHVVVDAIGGEGQVDAGLPARVQADADLGGPDRGLDRRR